MKPKNVSGWEYSLIAGGYATMYEIRYKMDIWDVLDLIEIMVIKESNIKIARDQIETKKR